MRAILAAAREFVHFRSFQQKISVYSFVLSLAAMASVSFFTFRIARDQVRHDRGQLMEVQARQISRILAIELENAAEDVLLWRNIGYIRQSVKEHHNEAANAFFDDVIARRKQYDLLFTIDSAGRICAVNSIGRRLTGENFSALLSGLPESWQEDVLSAEAPRVIDWRQLPALNALRGRQSAGKRPDQYQVGLAAAFRDEGPEGYAGIVVAILNWSRFQSILDTAESEFSALGLDTGYAFLFRNDADTIIGHKYWEEYGTSVVRDQGLSQLHEKALRDPQGTIEYAWKQGGKVAALTKVQPAKLDSQVEWRLGVGINNDDIFAPLQDLRLWFFLIPLMVAVTVAGVSLLFGRRVSVTLQQFARLARDASRGQFIVAARSTSDDELGNLAQAFNEMLVSFRAQLPFAAIPNPYVVGNPIRTDSMFYGRQQDLDWLRQQLENAGNKMLLLYGPRRIGKTSLLHQVNGGRAGDDILPFFFDTQQFIPELADDGDFYNILTRDLLAQLPQKMPATRAPFIAAERFTPQTFRNLLGFLHDAEPGKRPVLLFDELENLEYKMVHGSVTSDVFLFLAGLLDSELDVSFVVSGSDRLDSRRLRDWNILIPKTISRRIGLLDPRDARLLIEQPVHGYVLYDEGIPDRILRLTAGHPYYTQVICQTQIDCLNRDREFAVGAEQLAKTVQTVLHNPPPPLSHVWDSFSLPEKIAVAAAASILENEDDYVAAASVLEAVPAELRDPTGGDVNVRAALDTLSLNDWVQRSDDSEYRFGIDLLRLWIRHEHTVWHLMDELRRVP